jgi:hypothetical protein
MKRLLILILLLAAAGAAAQTLAPQRFAWTRPATGEPAVSYEVQLRENGGAWATVATVDDTFHVFTDLSAVSTWEVRVAGIDALGRRGAWSLPSLPLEADLGPPGAPGTPVLVEP